MDLGQLERYVEQSSLQELRVQGKEGMFVLGNAHTKPAWWYVVFEPYWDSSPTTHEVRGLQTIIALIESMYPELYMWLVSRFP